MSKLPFMKFNPADFVVDAQTLSLRETGAWMRLICYIWIHSEDGTVHLTNQQTMTLLQDEHDNAYFRTGDGPIEEPLTHALSLLKSLAEQNIFDYESRPRKGGEEREVVHIITSRRIAREKEALKLNAIHQSSYKARVRPQSGASKAEVRPKNTEIRSQKSDKDKVYVPAAPRFTKPNFEEVTAYCRERNNRVDAAKWLAYYESKGWVIGRAPMKDWRAAVRTWERNDFNTSINPAHQPTLPADQLKLANKTAELERIKEREWTKRLKSGEVKAGQTPPWAPPFTLPALKLAKDELGTG